MLKWTGDMLPVIIPVSFCSFIIFYPKHKCILHWKWTSFFLVPNEKKIVQMEFSPSFSHQLRHNFIHHKGIFVFLNWWHNCNYTRNFLTIINCQWKSLSRERDKALKRYLKIWNNVSVELVINSETLFTVMKFPI